MNKEEFKKYIESIGFYYEGFYYVYKKHHGVNHLDSKMYSIICHLYNYIFYNGGKGERYTYNDLKPLEKEFKKELRSIKLKQILE